MARRKMYQRADGLYEKKITISGKRHVFRAASEREVMQKIAAFQEREERGPKEGGCAISPLSLTAG